MDHYFSIPVSFQNELVSSSDRCRLALKHLGCLPSTAPVRAVSKAGSLLGHHLRKYYLLLLNNRGKQGFFIDKIFLSHANGTEEALRAAAQPFSDRFQSVTFLQMFHCAISAVTLLFLSLAVSSGQVKFLELDMLSLSYQDSVPTWT